MLAIFADHFLIFPYLSLLIGTFYLPLSSLICIVEIFHTC